jgi:uncharacterized iron-regulated membrane protein
MTWKSFPQGIKNIHRLLACLPVAAVILIMCVTGAILVWRSELERMIWPELYYVEEQAAGRLPLDELKKRIPMPGDTAEVSSMVIPAAPDESYMLSFTGQGRKMFFVDPYTGKLLGEGPAFFTKVMQLHRWLLLPQVSVGRQITRWGTILFMVLIVTGIILMIRMHRRKPAGLVTMHLDKGKHRFLFDLHTVGGVYGTGFLLLLCVTALSFGGSHHPPAAQKDTTQVKSERHGRPDRGERKEKGEGQWESVLRTVQAEHPDYRSISFRNNRVSVSPKQVFGNIRAADTYTFDPATGAILSYQPYAAQERSAKVRGWMYTLHVGAWGGLFSRILTCVASLMGGCLVVTGCYLSCRRRSRV